MQGLHAVEMFAGAKTITTAFTHPGLRIFELVAPISILVVVRPRTAGRKAASFEMEDSPLENILTGLGFSFGLALMLRLFACATRLQMKASCCTALFVQKRERSVFRLDCSGTPQFVARGCG